MTALECVCSPDHGHECDPALVVCDEFTDSDLGYCMNCGHDKECHDNP